MKIFILSEEVMMSSSRLALFFLCSAICLGAFVSAGQFPNRIGKAVPGEWASYTITNDLVRKFTVVRHETENNQQRVVLRAETIMNKVVFKTDETAHELDDANAMIRRFKDAEVEMEERTVEVRGTTYTATVVKGIREGIPFAVYLSDDIPVFGLLRIEIANTVFLEIGEFGIES